MAMKMKQTEYGAPTKQILAIPNHYVALGFKHAKADANTPGLATLVDGRYVVKAGTIYPANDATAIGVILNDYDVTDGDAMMAVVIHGFIKTAAIPAVPSSDAIAAMKQITFVPFIALNMSFEPTLATAVDGGGLNDIVGVASLSLVGATFRPEAADKANIATNWTITDTADADIDEITLSPDMKTATFKLKFASGKSAFTTGNLTVLPKANIISTGKTLTTAAKVFEVTAS